MSQHYLVFLSIFDIQDHEIDFVESQIHSTVIVNSIGENRTSTKLDALFHTECYLSYKESIESLTQQLTQTIWDTLYRYVKIEVETILLNPSPAVFRYDEVDYNAYTGEFPEDD